MRILVTGAGMVGCFLAKELCDAGDEVTLLEMSPNPTYIDAVVGAGRASVVRGNVLNVSDIIQTIQAARAQRIVHSAALLGASVDQAPYAGVQINVLGVVNVVEAAALTGIERIVYTSTGGVYDRRATAPMAERHPTGPSGLYSTTKLAAELVGAEYARQRGVEYVVLRYAIGYGPSFTARGSTYGRVIEDIVRAGIAGEAVTIRRAGPFLFPNEFVYAGDMARGAALALKSSALADRTFNIGTGRLHHLEDLLAALREVCPEARVTVEGDKAPDVRHPFDLARSREQLGYEPAYALVDGLRDYVATYRRMVRSAV